MPPLLPPGTAFLPIPPPIRRLAPRPKTPAPCGSGLTGSFPSERESFLEAVESLEGRGLLSLVWARHRKDETLTALVCRDPELLYELAEKPSPKTTAENVRAVARTIAAGTASGEEALCSFLSQHLTHLDAAGGIDGTTLTDLARLTQFLFDEAEPRRDEPPPGPSPGADSGGEKSGVSPPGPCPPPSTAIPNGWKS